MKHVTTLLKRPVIGVTGSDGKGYICWYFIRLGVWLAGGRAVRLTAKHHNDLERCEGFVIAGGDDISPHLYGEGAAAESLQYDTGRDALEQRVVRLALEKHIPLFGICRGMQIMNVTTGGTLYQEVGKVLEDFLPTQSLLGKILVRRRVFLHRHSRLYYLMGLHTRVKVNSLHHQAVHRVGEGFHVVAKEKNGLVQAIEGKIELHHPYLIGVQWHPELMLHSRAARRLFHSLVRTVKNQHKEDIF